MHYNNIRDLVTEEKVLSLAEYHGTMCSPEKISETLELVERMKRVNEIKREYKDKIKRRADGRQFYVYIGRKQYSAKSEEELYEKLCEVLYGKEKYSLSDVFPMFMKWKRDNIAPSGQTLKKNMYEFNRYIKTEPIANVPMKDLVSDDFTRLFRKWTCNRMMTLKLFNNLKSLINGIYSYACSELEIVQYNPISNINKNQFRFKRIKNDDDVFSIDDRKRILEHLKDNDDVYAMAIQFDFFVTMRIGELLALKWSDITKDGEKIYIGNQRIATTSMNDDLSFSKTKYETVDYVKRDSEAGYRYIPLVPEAQKILQRIKELNPNSNYIFERDGKQLYPNKFNEHLEKWCIECGVEPRSSHKIRFCVASTLYLNAVPLTTIQQLLGHTSVEMTWKYIRRVIKSDISVDLMEKWLA